MSTTQGRVTDAGQIRRVAFTAVHTSPLAQAGTGDAGGLNVYVSSVAEGLARRGVEVDVFTRRPSADIAATIEIEPCLRVHHIDAGPLDASKSELASHLCAFYLGMADHPAAQAAQVLHAHYWMSGWVGLRARRRLGMPLVQTFHTLARAKNAALAPGDRPESPLRIAAESRIAVQADAIIAPTPEESSMLRRHMGATRVHVVEPGVDLDVFRPDGPSGWGQALLRGDADGTRIVLFVGRLQPLKGPDTAIRAFAELLQMMPDDGIATRLVIVGGPSGNGAGTVDQPALQQLAVEVGVADRVGFLAPRAHAELAQLYRAADVVLMPSHSESFGLVALEAQACGTPVVATDVGGLHHVLGYVDGESGGGTLVADHSPSAFAKALLPLLTDQRQIAEAQRDGLRRAARLSWDRTVERSLSVYAASLGARDAEPLGA